MGMTQADIAAIVRETLDEHQQKNQGANNEALDEVRKTFKQLEERQKGLEATHEETTDALREAEKFVADLEKKSKDLQNIIDNKPQSDRVKEYYRKSGIGRFVVDADVHKGSALHVGRLARAYINAQKANMDPKDWVLKNWCDANTTGGSNEWLAEEIERIQSEKALSTGDASQGGSFVPVDYMTDFIPLLRAASPFREIGVLQIPMTGAAMTIPRQTGAATAYYVGEAGAITPSNLTTDAVPVQTRKLASLVVLSSEMMQDASPAIDQIVVNDLAEQMGQRESLAFLRGDGTAHTPLGIRYRAAAGNIFLRDTPGSAFTLDGVRNDLYDAAYRATSLSNVAASNPCWMGHGRTAFYLSSAQNTDTKAFPGMDMLLNNARPTLLGAPFFQNDQIPINLDVSGGPSGSAESEVYFFSKPNEVAIYDRMSMEISTSSEATINEGGVNLNLYQNDQVAIRAVTRHDISLRQSGAVSVITGVDWAV
tara:strand:- start:1160 stop:2605 length:1446 start_codon:yes stop_codon:yes gene_type:complete